MSKHIHRRPHGDLFTNPAITAVHALFSSLDEGDQRAFVQELQRQQALPLDPADPAAYRKTEALRSLTEAAQHTGGPPSIAEYEALRIAHPEYQWVPPRSVIRYLGTANWAESLQRAHLGTSHEPDVLTHERGIEFAAVEVTNALKSCTKDLGRVPYQGEYFSWAQRPDVRRLPGRRPLSLPVIIRHFGSFADALVAAELIDSSNPLYYGKRVKQRVTSVSDAEMQEALRLVANKLGRPPNTAEFRHERRKLIDAASANGKRFFMPTNGTIYKRWRRWDDALVAAGLEPLNSHRVSKTRTYKRPRSWSIGRVTRALKEARAALGDPLTATKYQSWRFYEMRRDGRRHYELPSVMTIRSFLAPAAWAEGCAAAFADDAAEETQAPEAGEE